MYVGKKRKLEPNMLQEYASFLTEEEYVKHTITTFVITVGPVKIHAIIDHSTLLLPDHIVMSV